MGAQTPADRELQGCDRFEWERIVRRCLIARDLKFTALVLAGYADQRGRNVRPGAPRLAAVLGVSDATARRWVDGLIRLGLVERTSRGGGPRKRSATYRLTLPSDLLETVPMLAPDERTPLTHHERSSQPVTQLTLDERSSTPDDDRELWTEEADEAVTG